MKVLVAKCRCGNVMKLSIEGKYITREGCSFTFGHKQRCIRENYKPPVVPKDHIFSGITNVFLVNHKRTPKRVRCDCCDTKKNRAAFTEVKV